ncbi:nucleoside phosphorylase [Streptomyces violaceusniger]|uniref:Uridine phosphorylase n=1 Tax=Streptomyces violaceusniger (strain Tu 4113) TaxID=653045 RepID=G2PI25_STRV4|nr:nucleoside phosphorylase [Streptomyces violaceusniger]AEM88976.1 purine or other phosphorylase family 1 [Streptomyces violaceusniger Tu 4113]
MTEAPFPLYPGKHDLPSVPDPAEHAAYVRARYPAATLGHCAGAVLVYQPRLMNHIRSRYRPLQRQGWIRGDLRILNRTGRKIAVCGDFGLGAPAAALVLEQLIALGVRRIVTVGTAASLQPHLNPGDLVVCDSALRDEGVSRHYLPPSPSITPPGELTARLTKALRDQDHVMVHQGPGWTTDAPYRETRAEIEQYAATGVMTADMEAAAVFAVTAHRRVEAAALFAVADSLTRRTPRRDQASVRAAARTGLETALDLLAGAVA